MFLTIYIILTVGYVANTDTSLETIDLATQQGILRGKLMLSRNGRQFYGFLKIPYAKPPLGRLRFKSPEEAEGWTGVRDATQDASICTQKNIFVKNRFFFAGDEDCLYLNVFTRAVPQNNTKLLPVMVYFHGGGWVTGSGISQYYPPGYLLDKDVVYVSANYRLGPMGFLSMEDEELSGNWGLKDQNLVLKWINKYIQSFGGDPNLVTIFGESAGGSSVHYHLLSHKSRGLFHRAISQSGTALCSWSLGNPGVTRNNTIKLAQLLECPTKPTKKLITCLQGKSAEDIISQDIHFMEWFKEPMIPFKPVVEKLASAEDAFLPEHPIDIIKKGDVADVPWITGVNSGDGALKAAAIYNENQLVEELNRDFDKIVPMSLFYRETSKKVLEVTQQIRQFYFGNKPVSNDTLGEVVDLWTDGWFLVGTDEAVRLQSKYTKAPIYYYYFAYRGSQSFSSLFGDSTRDFGVCHADELIYLFPIQQFQDKFTQTDVKFMDFFVELWTNFAKTGNPTPVDRNDTIIPVTWTPVSSTTNVEYLHIDEEQIDMGQNLHSSRVNFWSSINEIRGAKFLRDEL